MAGGRRYNKRVGARFRRPILARPELKTMRSVSMSWLVFCAVSMMAALVGAPTASAAEGADPVTYCKSAGTLDMPGTDYRGALEAASSMARGRAVAMSSIASSPIVKGGPRQTRSRAVPAPPG